MFSFNTAQTSPTGSFPPPEHDYVMTESSASSSFDINAQEVSSTKCFHGFKVKGFEGEKHNPMRKFTFQCQIGCGSYGTVYKALCERGCTVAIKSVNRDYKDLDRETRILDYISKFDHHNIITYFGRYQDLDKYNFVMEFGGENFDEFLDRNTDSFSKDHLNNILFQLLEMISHLNKIEIDHHDFCFNNMTYCRSSDTIKLIDFGSSKMPHEKDYQNPLKHLHYSGYQLG